MAVVVFSRHRKENRRKAKSDARSLGVEEASLVLLFNLLIVGDQARRRGQGKGGPGAPIAPTIKHTPTKTTARIKGAANFGSTNDT